MRTLAQLAPNRCVLGIGAGHSAIEYDALGLAYERPGQRIDRMIDLVDVVRRLLSGESVSHRSRWFALHDCALGVAAPGFPVPLLFGGNGDRVLAFAAERANIVGLTGFTSGTGRSHSRLHTSRGTDCASA